MVVCGSAIIDRSGRVRLPEGERGVLCGWHECDLKGDGRSRTERCAVQIGRSGIQAECAVSFGKRYILNQQSGAVADGQVTLA